jgi:hypothetical protein
MTVIGNKSKLANSEICQKCAKCCKEYVLYDTVDSALRFGWMLDKDIVTSDAPFMSEDGTEMKQITFRKECSKLCTKDGKYYCSVWNGERPDFCALSPDNLFAGLEKEDRKEIQEIIDFEKKDCPLFETMTVDEVIEKLWK